MTTQPIDTINYSVGERDELMTALNVIAASKSPTARERNTIDAHLLNARIARRITAQAARELDTVAEIRATEQAVTKSYVEFEQAILFIYDANRRALRK